MEITQPLTQVVDKIFAPFSKRNIILLREKMFNTFYFIRSLGVQDTMEEYEQRKLRIFNQLNFFQLITGILVPLSGIFNSKHLPTGLYFITCLPCLVSVAALYLNKRQQQQAAILVYFFFYPFVTSLVYMYGVNPGIGLFYIFYGILSVFFLKDMGYMAFSLFFTLISYFLLNVIIKHYSYELYTINYGLYLFNQVLAILFIFYGLFLIKKENAGYQLRILTKHALLEEKNLQIQEQAEQIQANAHLLQLQADQLGELNTLKNKMFGIISHDLKMPMYALRNLFRNVIEKKMSATELKHAVPDILNDLNYTVSLMDNLLQWTKAQMNADLVNPQKVDLERAVQEVILLLSLQARTKKITIEGQIPPNVHGYIDRNMNILVLRNLLSNAIKFTPENGKIIIGAHEHDSFVEIFVKDSGVGINSEAIRKINSSDFYSTNGTASESGTGLGLMLCKEFLARNGSQLHIESEPGAGSTFSYSIPVAA
ncbi:MAG TPA: HAMP domain-containing sensor histidine kinase [Chitinophagaceae bacterium]|nr:HAMP domain-containing sensor histidine kinase [Chitinophagaceae bacterium]